VSSQGVYDDLSESYPPVHKDHKRPDK